MVCFLSSQLLGLVLGVCLLDVIAFLVGETKVCLALSKLLCHGLFINSSIKYCNYLLLIAPSSNLFGIILVISILEGSEA